MKMRSYHQYKKCNKLKRKFNFKIEISVVDIFDKINPFQKRWKITFLSFYFNKDTFFSISKIYVHRKYIFFNFLKKVITLHVRKPYTNSFFIAIFLTNMFQKCSPNLHCLIKFLVAKWTTSVALKKLIPSSQFSCFKQYLATNI